LKKIQHCIIKVVFVVLCCAVYFPYVAHAQTQKKKNAVYQSKESKEVLADTPQKVDIDLTAGGKDSVIYIDPKTGKRIERKTKPLKPFPKPDKIIYVNEGTSKKDPETGIPRRIDTVIVLKEGKQSKQIQKAASRKDTPKIVVVKVHESCPCMALKVKAPDTLRIDDYINYSFALKNNCKKAVWVNSPSFTYYVFNPDGTPVKVLRKLQYVKQYRYPDFVRLEPGEEYVFDYGEDPFFQYDLRPNWKYQFSFTYRNTDRKYRPAPESTYLCNEFRNKTIVIGDKLRTRK
jgi:hypothetical protein